MRLEIELGEGKEGDEKYKDVLEYFWNLRKPYVFDPHDPNNVLMKLDENFQDTVNILIENGQPNARELDEFSYFHAVKFLRKKHKPNASQQSEFSSVE